MPSSGESRELRCLTAMSEGRRYFFEKIVNYAETRFKPSKQGGVFKDIIPVLRSDNSYHLAEFFYLVEELDLRDPMNLEMLIDRHNDDMTRLLNNKQRMILMGLEDPRRVEKARFRNHQKKKVLRDNDRDTDGKVILDQSDISKLLVNLMSVESCRQAIGAFYESQLLYEDPKPDPEKDKRGKVLVSSPGILEKYFRAHLSKIMELIGREEVTSTVQKAGLTKYHAF